MPEKGDTWIFRQAQSLDRVLAAPQGNRYAQMHTAFVFSVFTKEST